MSALNFIGLLFAFFLKIAEGLLLIGLFIARKLVNLIRAKTQHAPKPATETPARPRPAPFANPAPPTFSGQQIPPAPYPLPPAPQVSAIPAAQQQVISAPNPPPPSAAAPQPEQKPEPPTVSAILSRPDNGIYWASRSDLIYTHPFEEDLEEQVIRFAFSFMHKDGDPFTVVPKPDTSPAAPVTLPPLAPDSTFTAELKPKPLPPEDGAIWHARPSGYTRLDGVPIVLPKPPEPEPEPVADPNEGLILLPPVVVIPPPDDALWVARSARIVPIAELMERRHSP